MVAPPSISTIAALIGDPTRARILCELMDSRAKTAGELSRLTSVAMSTASGHLSKLVDGQLLVVEKQGRHRYFRLKSDSVAEALEALLVLTAEKDRPEAFFGPNDQEMREGRMCYDHIAGSLGLRLVRSMEENNYLLHKGSSVVLTPEGEQHLEKLGIDLANVREKRRSFARTCLDWSERQNHLAGALGAAIAEQLLAKRWVRRKKGSRVLLVTEAGKAGIEEYFPVSSR